MILELELKCLLSVNILYNPGPLSIMQQKDNKKIDNQVCLLMIIL